MAAIGVTVKGVVDRGMGDRHVVAVLMESNPTTVS
jgi:hypothetical protein